MMLTQIHGPGPTARSRATPTGTAITMGIGIIIMNIIRKIARVQSFTVQTPGLQDHGKK